MKKNIKITAGLICILAVCVWISAGTVNTQDEEVRQSIAETLTAIESVETGAYQSPDGRVDSLSEAEIQETIDAFNRHIDQYYASESVMRTTRKESNESALKTNRSKIDYSVSSGIEDLQINTLKLSNDGNEATVQYTAFVWGVWVVEDPYDMGKTGTFRVIAPVNKADTGAVFVKEDETWKLLNYQNDSLGMFPEPSENANSENRSKKILEQTYTSFEEALAAAQQIEFEELDHKFS